MALSIGVLAGGLSLEREVSLRSGRRVAEALTEGGHRVRELDLDQELVPTLAEGGFDLAFLTLHGQAGEDGAIQNLLDLLELPYTGPDAIASALSWDKSVFKGLLAQRSLPTPDWVALTSDAIRELGAARVLERVAARLGGPLVVKPSQGGASMGVRYVSGSEELAPALLAAFSYHGVALIERFIAGTEVAVSLLGGQPLPPVEIVPRHGHYDFAARYTPGATGFYVPARLDDATLQRCQDVAAEAYAMVGARHVSRVDMIVTEHGEPMVLEIDTCPGMTETSLLPMAADAAGCAFGELCERLVTMAVRSAGDDAAIPPATPRLSPG